MSVLNPNDYRARLETLAARLSSRLPQLVLDATRPTGSEGTAAERPAHDAAATGTEADEDVARAVLTSEQQTLVEARAALDRLDAGTFGLCEKCGRAISKVRLEAVPYARHCIRCARSLATDDARKMDR